GQLLARRFERKEGVGFAAEDEEDLHAKLDERLIEGEVGERLQLEKRRSAVDELQRHFGLGVVERIGGEAVEHARRIAEERLGVDELRDRHAHDRLLIRSEEHTSELQSPYD